MREDIPPRPYGPLIETTVRVVTWNVWGRYESWPDREAAIVATLRGADPDLVVLSESWATADDSQCARLAEPLGLLHHVLGGVAPAAARVAAGPPHGVRGGPPIRYAAVAGPRGPIQVYGLVMDAWWFD